MGNNLFSYPVPIEFMEETLGAEPGRVISSDRSLAFRVMLKVFSLTVLGVLGKDNL
jgi:hypothetical protein